MKINHLDLQVPDVRAAVAFFEQFFGLELRSNRNSPAIAILGDEAGFVLVLQRLRDETQRYPEGFHLGFLLASEEAVHAQHARMVAAGVPGVSAVDRNNRGTMFYCRAPGDVLVEVGHRPG